MSIAEGPTTDVALAEVGRRLVSLLGGEELLWIETDLDGRRVRGWVVAAPTEADDIPGWETLTSRERETLGLLATGMTARAIGTAMGISARTVSKHLEHAYAKLGRHDRLLVARELRTTG